MKKELTPRLRASAVKMIFLVVAAAVLLSAVPLVAQSSIAQGVTSSGCAPTGTPYSNDQVEPITIDASGKICVTGSFTASNPSIGSTGAAVPSSATYFAGNKSGNLVGVLIDASGNLQVSVQNTPQITFASAQPVTFASPQHIICDSGCGSGGGGGGTSSVDNSGFTYGTTSFTPAGGVYNTSITNCTSGDTCAFSITADRSLFVNLNRVGGSTIALGQTTMANSLPVTLASDQSNMNVVFPSAQAVNATDNITQWAGSTLGAMANYGTSPGAVLVPGVNAFITNTPAVTQSGTWNVGQSGAWNVGQSGTWNVGQSGTWTVQQGGAPWSDNITQFGGTNLSTGTGAGGAGIPRVTVSSDSTLSSVGSITNALPAGTNLLGEIVPMADSTTTNAALGCYLQSAASTNATNCKGSSGNFYGVRAVNTTGTIYYLRLYNTASAPTCSSSTGFIESIPIPAATTGAGIATVTSIPIGYATGISFCLTGGGSSTDNTNAATGVYISIYYK